MVNFWRGPPGYFIKTEAVMPEGLKAHEFCRVSGSGMTASDLKVLCTIPNFLSGINLERQMAFLLDMSNTVRYLEQVEFCRLKFMGYRVPETALSGTFPTPFLYFPDSCTLIFPLAEMAGQYRRKAFD